MIQRPNAVGLILCEKVIIEEGTRSMTLVSNFGRLIVDEFPSPPQHFTVYAILTDGLGPMTLALVIAHLDELETIYQRSWETIWKDPLREIRMLARVRSCSFPSPGRYQVSLLANNELITQSVLDVFQAE
jgi:hypothetical protein